MPTLPSLSEERMTTPSPSPTDDRERAAFEAWASEHGIYVARTWGQPDYMPAVQSAWIGFQAGRASIATPAPAPDRWQPIETAPKDGSTIRLGAMEGGRIGTTAEMQWSHIQRNGLFPGAVGMWVCPGGNFTWNPEPAEFGPTHWQPVNASPSVMSQRDAAILAIASSVGVPASVGAETLILFALALRASDRPAPPAIKEEAK